MKFLLLLVTLIAHADEATCLKTGTTCSDVDIDAGGAEASYRKGCDAGEMYSCSRLGQWLEIKKHEDEKALDAYERGCKGKDEFGCEQAKELRPTLCYIDGKKKFCDGSEPQGEFRVLVFLRTLNPKYADSFDGVDFDRGMGRKEIETLFQKRVKAKNKVVLKALERTLKSHKHDGADAEMVRYSIECIKKACPSDDFFE